MRKGSSLHIVLPTLQGTFTAGPTENVALCSSHSCYWLEQ